MLNNRFSHIIVTAILIAVFALSFSAVAAQEETPTVLYTAATADSAGLLVWGVELGEENTIFTVTYQPADSSVIFWHKESWVLDEQQHFGGYLGTASADGAQWYVFGGLAVQITEGGQIVFHQTITKYLDEGCWVRRAEGGDEVIPLYEGGCDDLVTTYSRPAGQ